MSYNHLSPNYAAKKVKDLGSGDLFIYPDGKDGPIIGMFINSENKSDRAILQLNNGCKIFRASTHNNNAAYVLLDNWRFRLIKAMPDTFEISPLKLKSGLISICLAGTFMSAKTNGHGDEIVIIDLDNAVINNQFGMKSAVNDVFMHCMYSDWIIESRANENEQWQFFYNPNSGDS